MSAHRIPGGASLAFDHKPRPSNPGRRVGGNCAKAAVAWAEPDRVDAALLAGELDRRVLSGAASHAIAVRREEVER
jgi:hypothetical protein